MPTNDFKAIATSGGANVITQAQLLALATTIANGLSSGILPSNLLNKLIRQSSFVSAAVAQYVNDLSGLDALDDGTGTFLANLKTAIATQSQSLAGSLGTDTSVTVNVVTVAFTPVVAAPLPGVPFFVKIANTNTGAVTMNGQPLIGGGHSALQGGELLQNAWALISWNATLASYILWLCTGAADQVANATQSGHAVNRASADARYLQLANVSGRNRLINGDMTVDQRKAGASLTFVAAAAVAYCVDRWYGSCTGANVTGQRAATTGGYTFTGLASNTGTLFGQRVEAGNISDLVSATVTGQIKASSTSITSVTWNAYSANAADNFGAKTLIATGALTINTVPTVYNFSFNAGANAANGVAVEFVTGALLAAQTLTYGTAQLEAGNVATAFERVAPGAKLLACQRYYEKSYDQATVPGTATFNSIFSVGPLASASVILGTSANFRTPKRVAPTTLQYWDGAGTANVFSARQASGWTNGLGAVSAVAVGENGFVVDSGYTTSYVGYLHFAASAEL